MFVMLEKEFDKVCWYGIVYDDEEVEFGFKCVVVLIYDDEGNVVVVFFVFVLVDWYDLDWVD